MTVAPPQKTEIVRIIDQMRQEELVQLWEFVQRLKQVEADAPIYHIHELALATGIESLAEQHDQYLYGTE